MNTAKDYSKLKGQTVRLNPFITSLQKRGQYPTFLSRYGNKTYVKFDDGKVYEYPSAAVIYHYSAEVIWDNLTSYADSNLPAADLAKIRTIADLISERRYKDALKLATESNDTVQFYTITDEPFC